MMIINGKEVTAMHYRICPDCGAHLDPGEICECLAEENAAGGAATPSTAE